MCRRRRHLRKAKAKAVLHRLEREKQQEVLPVVKAKAKAEQVRQPLGVQPLGGLAVAVVEVHQRVRRPLEVQPSDGLAVAVQVQEVHQQGRCPGPEEGDEQCRGVPDRRYNVGIGLPLSEFVLNLVHVIATC